MNVSDVEQIAPPVGDMLEEIFRRQKELLDKYIPIEIRNGRSFPVSRPPFKTGDLDHPAGQAFLKDEIMRVVIELVEAADCLKNKYWKTTQMQTDLFHFIEELVDAFHFFVELMIWLDVDARKLRDMYLKKNAVNQFRQRTNY